MNEVRRPLHDYLLHGGRDRECPYVFTSQRAPQLSEAGIHHWFRALKRRATKEQWESIACKFGNYSGEILTIILVISSTWSR